jgi:hypothetical protein
MVPQKQQKRLELLLPRQADPALQIRQRSLQATAGKEEMMLLIYPFWDISLVYVIWSSRKRQGYHRVLGVEKSRHTPHENGSTGWNHQIGHYD